MSKICRWIRSGIRAALFCISATAGLGVVYWLIERESIDDLIGASMLAIGFCSIGYVMLRRVCPRDEGDW